MSEGNPPVSTRRGDDGTTTLLGAGRLPKNDVHIALLGDVDEASASLGLARAEADDEEISTTITPTLSKRSTASPMYSSSWHATPTAERPPRGGKIGAGRPRSVFGSLYSYAAQRHLERE
jgi:hypothetical protein